MILFIGGFFLHIFMIALEKKTVIDTVASKQEFYAIVDY